MTPPSGLGERLDLIRAELEAVQQAREVGLSACRRTIRAAGSAIRAVHRQQADRAAELAGSCEAALREAQEALAPYPQVAFAGFLHDAEKEFAEAVLTAALVGGSGLPDHHELRVGLPAWLNGLAEAASELRRYLLDRLRAGELARAEELLGAMDDVYELVVSVDYPDAITGGLRRSADALRAVLERTRSDLTTTALQARLQAALERGAPPAAVT
ncbi:MAG: haloacid dehalogenase [Acidimicrobiales bacterium]